jgi:hypothetical protein
MSASSRTEVGRDEADRAARIPGPAGSLSIDERHTVGEEDRLDAGSAFRRWLVTLASPELLLLAPLGLIAIARLPLHSWIVAISAAALSLVLPVALGMATICVVAYAVSGRHARWTVVDVGLAAAVGLLLTLAAAQALAVLDLFTPRRLGAGVTVIAAAAWVGLRGIELIRPDRDQRVIRQWRRKLARTDALAIVAVAALGLAFAVWTRLGSPPPYFPTWDSLAHLRIVDGQIQGVWSPWTTDYSTTFRVNAYFPLQQLMVAMASRLTGIEPLAIYWGGRFVLMPAVAGLAYVLARAAGTNPLPALTAACAVLVAAYPFQALAFLDLAPLSIAMLGLLVMLLAAAGRASWPDRLAAVVVLGAGALAGHWFVGGAALAFGLTALALRAVEEHYRRLWTLFAIAVTGVATVMVLGYADIRQLPSRTFVERDPTVRELTRPGSLLARQRDVEARLSPIIAIGSAAGAGLLCVRAARRTDRRSWLAGLWAGSIVLVFLPIGGADRGLAALPAILAPTVAWLAEGLRRLLLAPGRAAAERGLVLGVLATGMIYLAALPAVDFRAFQRRQASESTFVSSFDASERVAADIIRVRTPRTSFLISDPVTQEVLGGLGDREAYGGGPYASVVELERLREALLAATPAEAWARLGALAPDRAPLLVAITGRTAQWLASPVERWVGYHRELEPFRDDPAEPVSRALRLLSNRIWFQPVWLGSDVVIVAVRPGAYLPVEGIGGPWSEATESRLTPSTG